MLDYMLTAASCRGHYRLCAANRTLEIGTGLFVLLGFAALLFLTTQLPASGLRLGSAKAAIIVTRQSSTTSAT